MAWPDQPVDWCRGCAGRHRNRAQEKKKKKKLAKRLELPSEKAARIVEAMRASVAERGIAGSTFDRVAREQAGVSRGLLHYYFGTKERLLVEVVRRESDVRGDSLEQAVRTRGGAGGLDELDRRPGAQPWRRSSARAGPARW